MSSSSSSAAQSHVNKRTVICGIVLLVCGALVFSRFAAPASGRAIARKHPVVNALVTSSPEWPSGLPALFQAFPHCGALWPEARSRTTSFNWSATPGAQLPALQAPLSHVLLDIHFLYMCMAEALRELSVDFVLARDSLLTVQRHMSPVPWGGATVLWVDANKLPRKLLVATSAVVRRVGATVASNTTKTLVLQLHSVTALVLEYYDRVGQSIVLRAPQSELEFNVSKDLVLPAATRPFGCDLLAPVPRVASAVLAAHYMGDLALCASTGNAGGARAVFSCGLIVDQVPWAAQQDADFDALVFAGELLQLPAASARLSQMSARTMSSLSTPRIIHLYAAAAGVLPTALTSCYKSYPGWAIRVWTATTLPFEPHRGAVAKAFLANASTASLGAFLILLEIQRVYGGLAMSGNITCVAPLPENILNSSFVAALGVSVDGAGIDGVVAAGPGHAHVHALLWQLGSAPTLRSFTTLASWQPVLPHWRPLERGVAAHFWPFLHAPDVSGGPQSRLVYSQGS